MTDKEISVTPWMAEESISVDLAFSAFIRVDRFP
jgi:hypothetical protein